MKSLRLEWKGPLTVGEARSQLKCPDMKRGGVYLWCLERRNDFIVIYVGKASNLGRRLKTELDDLEGGGRSLFRLSTVAMAAGDPDLHIEYIPRYDPKPAGEDLHSLIVRNVDAYRMFFAPVTPMDGWPGFAEVEGAIQAHLWREPTTRMYLITGVSNWALTDTLIHNTFRPDVTVLGLDSAIKTPVQQSG